MLIARKKILTGLVIVVLLIAGGIVLIKSESGRSVNETKFHVTAEAISLNGGWGYKIDVNNKPFIYQNQIPCIPGNKPFPNEKSAMAVAQVVMNKIEHGQLPSVTIAEIEQATGIKDLQ